MVGDAKGYRRFAAFDGYDVLRPGVFGVKCGKIARPIGNLSAKDNGFIRLPDYLEGSTIGGFIADKPFGFPSVVTRLVDEWHRKRIDLSQRPVIHEKAKKQ
ncbi:hypothetical protein Slin_2421 [Spirosoma linguale DSM 74]|uniref:Uncharacterized protein n=1 Tax=Spirosoma linguale (strain ATCC 33905 / DSM 74 / LMG 10896 / Claus 1) TaxID=504472 RepID=D2QFR7_SPILD|nr:hypothetical protein Slin_2421 [Spirosoma linguale DSM 74]